MPPIREVERDEAILPGECPDVPAIVGRERAVATERVRAEVVDELERGDRRLHRVRRVERAALRGVHVDHGLVVQELDGRRCEVLLPARARFEDDRLQELQVLQAPHLHADSGHGLAAREGGVPVAAVGRDQAVERRRGRGTSRRDDQASGGRVRRGDLAYGLAVRSQLREPAGRRQQLHGVAAIARGIDTGRRDTAARQRDEVVRTPQPALRAGVVDGHEPSRERLPEVEHEGAIGQQPAREQPPIGARLAVHVVRLVAARPYRIRAQHLAVRGRRGIGVDDGEEIAVLPVGVAGPYGEVRLADEERRLRPAPAAREECEHGNRRHRRRSPNPMPGHVRCRARRSGSRPAR